MGKSSIYYQGRPPLSGAGFWWLAPTGNNCLYSCKQDYQMLPWYYGVTASEKVSLGDGDMMQEKALASVFLEIFVVTVIIGVLAAVAVPNFGRMANADQWKAGEAELHDIQTAVTEMMFDSDTGALVPVGPTSDMDSVKTSDTPPLRLVDYLLSGDRDDTGQNCSYTFTADGTVIQCLPK